MYHWKTSLTVRRGAAAALAAAMLCLPAVSWSGIYRWTDAHGGVHYTQTPPLNGAYTALQGPPPPPDPGTPAAPAPPSAAPAPAGRTPAAAPPTPQRPAMTDDQRHAACSDAQQRLVTLRHPHILMKSADGTVRRLTEDERQQELAATQKHIADVCPQS